MENAKNPYFTRDKMWKTFQQNTTCKQIIFVHIILIQEDSMSGGCVYYVRRDVLSKCFKLFLNVGLMILFLCIKDISMIDSNQIFKKDFKESYLLVSGGNFNISQLSLQLLRNVSYLCHGYWYTYRRK